MHDPSRGAGDYFLATDRSGNALRALEHYRPDEDGWADAQIELSRQDLAQRWRFRRGCCQLRQGRTARRIVHHVRSTFKSRFVKDDG